MTAYMQKTKQQLVEIIQTQSKTLSELQARLVQAEALKDRFAKECDGLHSELTRFREDAGRILKEKDLLTEKLSFLEQEMDDLRGRLHDRESQIASGIEIFKSFVDDDASKILLIDASYAIRYVNRAAMECLGVASPDGVIGQRIFDRMNYQDALKFKEKIDRTFLSGEPEKARDVRLRSSNGGEMTLKVKLMRVRYENRPSLKLVIQ